MSTDSGVNRFKANLDSLRRKRKERTSRSPTGEAKFVVLKPIFGSFQGEDCSQQFSALPPLFQPGR